MKITMKEIAQKSGVSTTTVSHVINGTKRISPETETKILDIINQYNYVPNYAAKKLKGKKTNIAGLIVPSFPDSFVTEYTNSITMRAKECGYNLLFVNTNEDLEYEKETLKLFNSKLVDGVILSPSADVNQPLPSDFKKLTSDLPVVLISRKHDDLSNFPTIIQDDYQSGFEAGNHLAKHGKENMAIIYSVLDISSTRDRIKGFRESLLQNGLEIKETNIIKGNATVKGGKVAVNNLLKNDTNIEAIFILNDSMTVGGVSALKEMDIEVPREVALIGFGDFPEAEIINPSITTVNSSAEIMGRTAFDMLMKKINDKNYYDYIEIPTKLIRRGSCGCN